MKAIVLPLASLLSLLLCSCNLPPAAAAPQSTGQATPLIRYNLRAQPVGNLFYQLDCLAGQGYCSEPSYRALWQSLGWSDADAQRLKQWQALRQRYDRQVQLGQPGDGFALPPRFDGIRLWDKVREASFNAANRQELALNLATVLRPADAEQLMELMAAFEPRFVSWWNSKGRALAESGATAFAGMLGKDALPQLIDQASSFYRARLSSQSVLGFNFFARPDLGERNLNGEQIENQSAVEILENGPPTSNLDVTIHEFCHYLFARAAREDEKNLIEKFSSAGTPEAIAAYNLLNEVIATAIGNGLVSRMLMPAERFQRYLQTPKTFYNDDFIDPLAKAVYLRVEQALKAGETISDQAFVKDYLQLANASLGSRLRQPLPLLRTMAAAYEGQDLAGVLQDLQRRMRIGSVWGANALDANARGSFERFSAISGVLLLKPDQISRLKDWESLLGAENLSQLQSLVSTQSGSFVYGIQRRPNAWIFVLVAPDAAGFAPLIEKLATAQTLFTGRL